MSMIFVGSDFLFYKPKIKIYLFCWIIDIIQSITHYDLFSLLIKINI